MAHFLLSMSSYHFSLLTFCYKQSGGTKLLLQHFAYKSQLHIHFITHKFYFPQNTTTWTQFKQFICHFITRIISFALFNNVFLISNWDLIRTAINILMSTNILHIIFSCIKFSLSELLPVTFKSLFTAVQKFPPCTSKFFKPLPTTSFKTTSTFWGICYTAVLHFSIRISVLLNLGY